MKQRSTVAGNSPQRKRSGKVEKSREKNNLRMEKNSNDSFSKLKKSEERRAKRSIERYGRDRERRFWEGSITLFSPFSSSNRFYPSKESSGDEAEKSSELPPLLASLARGDANAAKMVLAYEISVNEDFQMVNAREDSKSVQGQVAQTMERAFWDILSQGLIMFR